MRREKDLLERVIDFESLHRAFRRASAGKRDRRAVREFEFHLETRLWEIRREVAAGAYAWGPYRSFFICDPKRREIRAAPVRDRVLHHAIVGVVDPIFERGFIADTYACIRGRGQHRAVALPAVRELAPGRGLPGEVRCRRLLSKRRSRGAACAPGAADRR